MARLRDLPHVFRTVGPIGFVKRVYQQVSEDALFTYAAAMAYSWIFAIFPFFIFLLTLAPYLPYNSKKSAQSAINEFAREWLPGQASRTLQTSIKEIMDQPQSGLLSIGLILTLWVASGGMATTMNSLDRCYDIEKPRGYFKQRFIAILLTIVVAALVLCVLVLFPLGTLVIRYLSRRLAIDTGVWLALNLSRYVLGLVLLLTGIGLVYHFGPSLKRRFHAITPGAVFTIIGWMLLGLAFRFYVERFGNYNKTYGAVGGVAILLGIFYLDGLVMLIGAEIDSEVDFVTLGLPSTESEPAPPPAPDAIEDPEERELAEELRKKRGPTPVPGDATGPTEPGSEKVAAQQSAVR